MIILRSQGEIKNISAAGKVVHEVLDVLCQNAVAGETTGRLNEIAEALIIKRGARAAFKGYKGYPAAICASVNESIVHEIPSEHRILVDGDIISFDVGAECNGYFADAARTVGVGRISQGASQIIEVTRDALAEGIECAREGNRVSDISHAVQVRVEKSGFSVVRHFVGHGIGRALHEEPEIPNFGQPHKGARLKEGMVLAIEPMVNAGSCQIEVLEDGWTAVTKDRLLSAHFEHTICVKKGKAEILT